jgi:hypothetical protein
VVAAEIGEGLDPFEHNAAPGVVILEVVAVEAAIVCPPNSRSRATRGRLAVSGGKFLASHIKMASRLKNQGMVIMRLKAKRYHAAARPTKPCGDKRRSRP